MNPYAGWEKNFTAHMRRLREAGGMRQTDLARALKTRYQLPFHQQTIQRIENGDRPVRLDEAFLIAKLFDVDLETMTGSISAAAQDLVYAADRVRSRAAGMHAGLQELMSDWTEIMSDLLYEIERRDGAVDDVTLQAMAFAVHAGRVYGGMCAAWRQALQLDGEAVPPSSGDFDFMAEWRARPEVAELLKESPLEVYQGLQDAARAAEGA